VPVSELGLPVAGFNRPESAGESLRLAGWPPRHPGPVSWAGLRVGPGAGGGGGRASASDSDLE
jgi:hypothetical protein